MEKSVLTQQNRVPVNLPDGNDHPVVDMPFTAVIDGRQFRGRGLSLVAAYVAGLMDPAALNAVRIARLVFQFDGFALTLDTDVEVREGAPGSGEAELIFIRPTGPHLPQLRHILNSFIAGDLVGMGRAIGVAGTAAPKAPKAAQSAESRLSLRRILGGAAVGALSLALLAVAGTLVYQRMFVMLVPNLGTVVSTAEVLRATSTGQILFLDLTARKNDVVVAIQTASGDVQSLVMPCDCVVTSDGVREGSTVLIGEPVLQLVSATDQRLVEVSMPPNMLFDLASADGVKLTFPDGVTTSAQIAPAVLTGDGNTPATTLFRPEMALLPERMGQPVQIRIQRNAGSLGIWANAARARVVSLF